MSPVTFTFTAESTNETLTRKLTLNKEADGAGDLLFKFMVEFFAVQGFNFTLTEPEGAPAPEPKKRKKK